MSSSAIGLRKSIVSSLCNYIENIISEDDDNYKNFRNFTRGLPPIPKNRVYDKIKVTKEEYDMMMNVLENDENWLGMAWLATAFRTGARRSEIIQFKTEILNYEVPEDLDYVMSHTVRGKGASQDGKKLEYMIPLDVLPYWQKWIESRGYESEYIFTTKYGNEIKPMSARGQMIFAPILSLISWNDELMSISSKTLALHTCWSQVWILNWCLNSLHITTISPQLKFMTYAILKMRKRKYLVLRRRLRRIKMKANIYGFEVEGTPDEIVAFKNKLDNQTKQPNQYTYTISPIVTGDPPFNSLDWNKIICSTKLMY